MALTRAQKRAIESQQQPEPNKRRKQSGSDTPSPNEAARALTKSPPSRNPPSGNPPLVDKVDEGDPIAYWVREQVWPYEYIKDDPDRQKIIMHRILSRKKSVVGRKRPEPASISSGTENQTNASYRNRAFVQLLQMHGSFMEMSKLGIADESRDLCMTLLDHEQRLPRESLFDDDIFQTTCQRVASRNEAIVVRDILPLIVPSAEISASRIPKLECLIESVNEVWSNSEPVTTNRPQPDYSVGFKRKAFTEEELDKIAPVIGDFIAGDQSIFMATSEMYFPFLTCEAKCGVEALEYADRQNTHSMTLAVRAIVELFRLVKRESELHLQILAFSVSHNHEAVRIYGHYPVIDKTTAKVEYYRHPIRKYDFTELNGRDKWTAYRFTKNIYDIWVPMHLERICSAIDQIELPELNNPGAFAETGLTQELESNQLSLSNVDVASSDEVATTDTPISSTNAKKQRRGR